MVNRSRIRRPGAEVDFGRALRFQNGMREDQSGMNRLNCIRRGS
jgi:hypothetical protein